MDEKNNVLNEQSNCEEQNKTPELLLPQMYAPKPLFNLTRRDTIFAVCSIVLCIFTSIFGIFGGFSFGYLLSLVFTILLLAMYFAKGGKVQFLPIICGALALGNSAVFICTTNGSVRFFAVIISFLLSLVCFDGIVNGSQEGNRQSLGVFYSAASTIGNIGVSLKSLISNSNGDKKTIGKALVGIICAIPVLFVVIPLLISSDDAFRGMMNNIFSNTFTTILKAIFGILLSIFVVSYIFSLKTGRVLKTKESKFLGIENTYVVSFLSVIAVCYLMYLFSQLAYFFSAFKGFLPDGEVTYAEYARKGFFEMCIIAVINLVIVFLSLLLAKKQNGKVCHGIKAIATFISVFTIIIIATAVSKMMLYIKAYGMTVLRVTTSAFMLFLAIVFLAVILKIYINKINIVKTALITAGCIVIVLGTVNVNAVCARYNYKAYKTNKLDTIDVEALYQLGDEGIPYVVRLACCKDKYIAQEAQNYLVEAYMQDYFDDMTNAKGFSDKSLSKHQKYTSFSYFNIPRKNAYDILYKFIKDNPDFDTYCISHYDDGGDFDIW